MPVIAKLSKRFYEVVGEDVTQQLVDWMNAVEEELTRRATLRIRLTQRMSPPGDRSSPASWSSFRSSADGGCRP